MSWQDYGPKIEPFCNIVHSLSASIIDWGDLQHRAKTLNNSAKSPPPAKHLEKRGAIHNGIINARIESFSMLTFVCCHPYAVCSTWSSTTWLFQVHQKVLLTRENVCLEEPVVSPLPKLLTTLPCEIVLAVNRQKISNGTLLLVSKNTFLYGFVVSIDSKVHFSCILMTSPFIFPLQAITGIPVEV